MRCLAHHPPIALNLYFSLALIRCDAAGVGSEHASQGISWVRRAAALCASSAALDAGESRLDVAALDAPVPDVAAGERG